jgi:hypothetical protein
MKTIDLFLSEQKKYDTIIEHNVKLEMLKDTFCFNCNGNNPNKHNILNNKISLFTFENEMVEHMLDISKISMQNTKHNIADEFLSYISQCKYKTTNYRIHIKNYVDIKKYIDTECNEKIRNDMCLLKKEACIIRSNNNEKNITCSRLLSKLMELCKERFTDVGDTICSIPFIKNDTINYFYTITAGTISRTYLIKVILV